MQSLHVYMHGKAQQKSSRTTLWYCSKQECASHWYLWLNPPRPSRTVLPVEIARATFCITTVFTTLTATSAANLLVQNQLPQQLPAQQMPVQQQQMQQQLPQLQQKVQKYFFATLIHYANSSAICYSRCTTGLCSKLWQERITPVTSGTSTTCQTAKYAHLRNLGSQKSQLLSNDWQLDIKKKFLSIWT